MHLKKSTAFQNMLFMFKPFYQRLLQGWSCLMHAGIWHRMNACRVRSPDKLLMQQATQQVAARFAKEMGAEARERRIDR